MIYLVGCEAVQVKEGCGCRRAKGIQEQRQTQDCHIFQAAIIKVKTVFYRCYDNPSNVNLPKDNKPKIKTLMCGQISAY
jgi:hypothetical protein